MIENLQVSFNAVAPMFFIIALGYYIRHKELVQEKELDTFNSLAFHIFLPCQLFINVIDSDIKAALDLKLIVFTVLCVLLIYFLAFGSVIFFEKKEKCRGVMIQAIFRSNFVLLGIPLVSAIYDGSDFGMVPVMIAIIVPLFNVLAVITLELFRNRKADVKSILLGIMKNPLIIGSVIGLIAKSLNFPFYEYPIFSTTIGYLGQIATPLMLFILGASFRFSSVSIAKKQILFCCIGKLLISPAIVFFLAERMGLHGMEIAILLGAFASPPAANSYNMARQMGGDAALAANLVVLGTMDSCITLFFWIFILQQMQMI